tara:strand:- start:5438 stop:6139 length:702 start_codon:yes stop_codon:yes gene_type:complete
MDVIDKLNSIMSSYSGKLDSLVGENHKIDAIIIVYVILFLVVKPCKATEITKMPIIQLGMIASILYIARTNQITATLLAVAFLITLGTNSHECNHSRLTKDLPIEDRERFTGNDEVDVESNNTEDMESDNESEEDSDEEDSDEEDSEEEDVTDYTNSKDDESDSDSESDDEEKKDNVNDKPKKKNKKKNKEKNKKIEENFALNKLLPKNSINDTFKDLHMAIHKLENFVNTDN